MIRLAMEADGLARLILDRPQARNAVDVEGWRDLGRQIAAIDFEQARVLVVESGVEGIFCPGADIKEFSALMRNASLRAALRKAMHTALSRLEQAPIPVLAVIDGACVGAGASIALCCDLRIASSRARFGITPAKLGLVYSGDDLRRLHAAVGGPEAKMLLFTADLVDAAEALRIGLVHRVVETATVATFASEVARRIAANSAATHRSVKTILGRLGRGRRAPSTRRAFQEAFASREAEQRIEAVLQDLGGRGLGGAGRR